MNYQIDILINIKKAPNINIIKNNILNIANKFNCYNYYEDIEIKGKYRKIIKNDLIISLFFETNNIINFIHSIKNIKNIRIITIISNDKIILPKFISYHKKKKLTVLKKNILKII